MQGGDAGGSLFNTVVMLAVPSQNLLGLDYQPNSGYHRWEHHSIFSSVGSTLSAEGNRIAIPVAIYTGGRWLCML